MVSTEVERRIEVDTAEVPSAAWGWSKINHRTWRITGLVVVVFLLAMLRGNHVGHIEDWFLIAFAAVTLFVVVRDWWGRRRGWLR
ncbi:DUF2631 domain-containing protein [uncultured Mycobacterium sp.]|uniref:DUF2631 domain-containing protein n=1 Tax=uncultured Mycobacterium sp. TaxID=171292 RepID=UPI0035CBAE19